MLSILKYLKLQKELHNFVTDNVFRQKVKTQQQQNKKIKHKHSCRCRELNTGPLGPKPMRNHCTIESTENIDCSQSI